MLRDRCWGKETLSGKPADQEEGGLISWSPILSQSWSQASFMLGEGQQARECLQALGAARVLGELRNSTSCRPRSAQMFLKPFDKAFVIFIHTSLSPGGGKLQGRSCLLNLRLWAQFLLVMSKSVCRAAKWAEALLLLFPFGPNVKAAKDIVAVWRQRGQPFRFNSEGWGWNRCPTPTCGEQVWQHLLLLNSPVCSTCCVPLHSALDSLIH